MISINNRSDSPEIISVSSLRRLIGWLALLLPIILILGAAVLDGCQLTQNSISAYYHTVMRNFFVGLLCAVAVCLFAYRGYSKTDSIMGTIAAVCALGIAFFPTSVDLPATDCLPVPIVSPVNTYHLIFSAAFFLLLAFFCLVLFTKGAQNPTPRKLQRNRIFRICGYGILACIVLIAIYFWLLEDRSPRLQLFRPVFYLEALALVFFSISWLTKGEVIMGDD